MSSYNHYLQGKAIQTGCEWRLKFKIISEALVSFPPSAKFVAHVRDTYDGPLKAELTTENGRVIRVSGNELELVLPAEVTKNWEAGKVVMDVIRTDLTQPIHLGFDLEIPVKRSVTRL